MEATLVLDSARTVVSNHVGGLSFGFSSLDGTGYNVILDLDKSEGYIEFNNVFDLEVRLLRGAEMSDGYGLERILNNIVFLDRFCGLNLYFYSNGQLTYSDYISLNTFGTVGWYNVESHESLEYEFVPKEVLLSEHEGLDVVEGGVPIDEHNR